jgi:hypothetical protein
MNFRGCLHPMGNSVMNILWANLYLPLNLVKFLHYVKPPLRARIYLKSKHILVMFCLVFIVLFWKWTHLKIKHLCAWTCLFVLGLGYLQLATRRGFARVQCSYKSDSLLYYACYTLKTSWNTLPIKKNRIKIRRVVLKI